MESLFEDEEDQDQPRPQALESSCSEETSKVCYLVYLQNLFAAFSPFYRITTPLKARRLDSAAMFTYLKKHGHSLSLFYLPTHSGRNC